MNIFYLYDNPVMSAEAQPDKMLVKMPLETAQMLCTAHRELDGAEYTFRYGKEHASISKLAKPLMKFPKNIKLGKMTPLAQAMPDKYKHKDPIVAYRRYVVNEKHYAKWEKGRPMPNWWHKEAV
jgi:hypothetical protein